MCSGLRPFGGGQDSRTAPGPFIPRVRPVWGRAWFGRGAGGHPGFGPFGAGAWLGRGAGGHPGFRPFVGGAWFGRGVGGHPGFRPFDCGGVCSGVAGCRLGVAGCRLGAVLSVCGLTQPLRFAIPGRLVAPLGLPAPVAALGDKSDLLASGFDYKSDLLTSGFDYKSDELKRIWGNIRRNAWQCPTCCRFGGGQGSSEV